MKLKSVLLALPVAVLLAGPVALAQTTTKDTKAPEAGANSFTEAQAKDRIVAAGFTSVSSLAKDGDGVWRGNAMKDGKAAKVAVDFKGNVVSQ